MNACTSSSQNKEAAETSKEKAARILTECYNAHGGDLYETAHYSFIFREKTFSFKNEGDQFEYTRVFVKKRKKISDRYTNTTFTRELDGRNIELTDEKSNKLSNSLNSVIYFATLPHKLNDSSVNKELIGTDTLKNKRYDVLGISFNQEGGGDDFEDEYLYWINQETSEIDFLAYNYQVNGGGVRFRAARNKRKVEGLLFQDYVNYEARVGTPLQTLLELYKSSELKKLSVIESSDVYKVKS